MPGWRREQPFTEELVRDLLLTMADRLPEAPPQEIRLNTQYSNELAQVWYPDGRTFVVKRARYAQMASRFHTDHLASRLLRSQAGVLAPDCEVLTDRGGEPVLVYWWIPNPTLEELWTSIPEASCPEVLQDWGRLMRRIHAIQLPSHGPLLEAVQGSRSLGDFLRADLVGRLEPEIRYRWPEAEVVLQDMIRVIPEVQTRAGAEAALIHNDLFNANVICEQVGDTIRCVGVLDLEDAFAGPPEADLARTEILHGPLFGRPLEPTWFSHVLAGYGNEPDPLVHGFFRAFHMLNMGYYARLTGLDAHAADVQWALERELAALGSGTSHHELLLD